MYKYSKRSLAALETCDPQLQEVFNEAIKVMDISILEGHRGEEEQNEAYNTGASNAKWGGSDHNTVPSNAVDAAPYPIDWNDAEGFARMAGVVDAIAFQKGIKIKWGGDFKSFKDRPHFQLDT